MRLELSDDDEWASIDSETLRGTTAADDQQGESALLAVTHTKRHFLAQLSRKANLKNFQAAPETFCDCRDRYRGFLCQTTVS